MAIEFEIMEHIGVISEKKSGWKKELTMTSWGGRAAKYDIREWDSDYESMGKGVTFTREELLELYYLLEERFGEVKASSKSQVTSGDSLSSRDILKLAQD